VTYASIVQRPGEEIMSLTAYFNNIAVSTGTSS